ncbi:N-acetyltransferase [Breoghania sp.]|uniref:GNAT family N-acetyltransferase n=1 Tax=Breoghania sp. TaxID=2065378 RepID=UPI002AA81B86|nr:N-acetyltransferase [Breoghania sp.]
MNQITIRPARAGDCDKLHDALVQLSTDIGDDHAASANDLLRHGFTGTPAFFALLAETPGKGDVVGALMASPLFSTTNAGVGLYVSDLWVSASTRGAGLGQRLLAAAVRHAEANWTVRFIKLTVYRDNPRAHAFYERLGFAEYSDETVLTLKGPALENLRKKQ